MLGDWIAFVELIGVAHRYDFLSCHHPFLLYSAWNLLDFFFFFWIDNKSFIVEKEQCVYNCKLTALETNTIKS